MMEIFYLILILKRKNGKTNVKWSIYQQNPLQGQIWQDASNFSDYSFGVNFLQMNDHYDKTYRSTKYAILFIGLTFVAFFFIESRNNFNIHLVQYALVGFAICVNFVLLLSLSEYLGFDLAYFISSGATILLITFFCQFFPKIIWINIQNYINVNLIIRIYLQCFTTQRTCVISGKYRIIYHCCNLNVLFKKHQMEQNKITFAHLFLGIFVIGLVLMAISFTD